MRKTFPTRARTIGRQSALTRSSGGGVSKFSLLWLSEPDLTQHELHPARRRLAAIRSSDRNLAGVLAALKAKNALATTDIFIVSDHGFSTVDGRSMSRRNYAQRVSTRFAFSVKSRSAEQILVVSLGGSVTFYVVDHEQTIKK